MTIIKTYYSMMSGMLYKRDMPIHRATLNAELPLVHMGYINVVTSV